ncbi:MAG TPA: BON domain-containing protein [Thermoanaerobaculia bacterium]
MNIRRFAVFALALLLIVPAAAGVAAAQEKKPTEQDANYAKELEIRDLLLEKGGDKALGIQVTVDRTKAILTGQVPTRAAQELAEEVALSVDGIKSVDNRLRITPPPGGNAVQKADRTLEEETADALLESKVKRHLYNEIGKRAKDLEVEAVDGVVSLRGTLPDASRKQIALDAATKTKGVKKVLDLIKVKP